MYRLFFRDTCFGRCPDAEWVKHGSKVYSSFENAQQAKKYWEKHEGGFSPEFEIRKAQ